MSASNRSTSTSLAAAVVAAALLAACATNPATGRRQLALIGEQQEIALGREADQQVVASMGLYEDEAVQAYVQQLGARLAAQSERPELPWTFRVIDDPAVNAFALPGGFIYVTRGIMTHLNSEAELVGVLGHEIGHVTARHSVSQLSKQQLAGLGLGIGMILSPELRQFGDLAQSGLGLLFLKYSRDDERQADDLGLRYAVRTEYDPRQMAGVFDILERVSRAEDDSGRLPDWLSTHPNPSARRTRLVEDIEGLGLDFAALRVAREPYLARIDGMVFGANPREGFFEGRAFLHPDLEFRFEFPGEWKTVNQKQSVVGVSPRQDAAIQVTLAAEESAEQAARRFFAQQGVRLLRSGSEQLHGLPAVWGSFAAQAGQTAVAGIATFVEHGGRVYRLLGYGVEGSAGRWEDEVRAALRSFQRLRDPEALAVQPARLDVVELRQSLSLEEFEQRHPSTVPLSTLALINHVAPGEQLPGGDAFKRVIGGRPVS